jgi:L,D-transpeptidase YcbB
VKRLRTSGCGCRISASLMLIVLFCGSGAGPGSSAQTQLATSSTTSPKAQGLSSEGQAWLGGAISSGSFADLRWPDFSDYSKHAKKFYEFNGDSLWWVKGMEPTTQARQVIALMLQADHKGLSADDYDRPRWNDRLVKLKPVTRQPTEADAVKFDLALTICAMRYISDLHIGKVNPKHFDFVLDDESKKYDLAEFLKDHVVDAGDVPTTLAQVEPQYPGYRRTIQALQTYMDLAKKDDGEQLLENISANLRKQFRVLGPMLNAWLSLKKTGRYLRRCFPQDGSKWHCGRVQSSDSVDFRRLTFCCARYCCM